MATASRPVTAARAPRRPECVTQPFELPRVPVALAASATHVGLHRATNQDSVLVTPRLLAVADGMGGANAGEVASRLAVDTLRGTAGVADPAAALAHAVRCANAAVHGLAASAPDLRGMGTTLTAVALGETGVTVAHVGDSRLYRLRDGRLERLTRDHSMAEGLRDAGGEAAVRSISRPLASVLLRAIGAEAEVAVDVETHDVRPTDVLLLCTDGLTKHLLDEEIAAILAAASSPEEAVGALVDTTLARGASDNVGVLVFRPA